jgi:DNA helicase-2/ATP-dependent DNA helicase PcrA
VSASILDVVARPFEGDLVRITLKSGRVLRMTPNHMCFARLGPRRGSYWVYLMYRRDLGYCIGVTAGERCDPVTREPLHALPIRVKREAADRAWLLRYCETRAEASLYEQVLSVTYGLPTMVFCRTGRRLMLTQEDISRLFQMVDTRRNAARLMADFGLSFEHPHHRTQATTLRGDGPRFQVHLSLFGGNSSSSGSGGRRYHRVWVNSRDRHAQQRIEAQGIPTRMGSKGTWRVDRHFRAVGPP